MRPRSETLGALDVKTHLRASGRLLRPVREVQSKVALLYPATVELTLRSSLEACADVTVGLFPDRIVGTDWDVIVVDATPNNLTSIEFAFREWENLGTPEVVVAPSEPSPSVEAALAHFRIRYIVPLELACVWVPQAIHALAGLARARRAEKRALDILAEIPPPTRDCAAETHPLFTAESAFREAYLRLLVARSPTVRGAASTAGVPYRSFQRMLTTYGIRRPESSGSHKKGDAT